MSFLPKKTANTYFSLKLFMIFDILDGTIFDTK